MTTITAGAVRSAAGGGGSQSRRPAGLPFCEVGADCRAAGTDPASSDPPAEALGFMSHDELDVYGSTFQRTGMVGAFNRYRAIRLDGPANIVGATLDQPSCFIAGEHDLVRSLLPGVDLFASPGAACSDFRGSTIVQRAGHWVQEECPRHGQADARCLPHRTLERPARHATSPIYERALASAA